jgi:hypothetical protein
MAALWRPYLYTLLCGVIPPKPVGRLTILRCISSSTSTATSIACSRAGSDVSTQPRSKEDLRHGPTVHPSRGRPTGPQLLSELSIDRRAECLPVREPELPAQKPDRDQHTNDSKHLFAFESQTGTRRLTPVEAASGNEDLLRYCNTNSSETFLHCNSSTDNGDFKQAGRPNQAFVRCCCRICIDSKPEPLLPYTPILKTAVRTSPRK